MKAGEFPNGARVLRAKIDMAAGNINLRDPVLYRILHAHHPRTGDKWSIYPSYDYAHGQSDAIEGITHSICTLEFEDHRPLYDWLLDKLPVPSKPHQYEFARLNLTYTLLSKRVLTQLVRDGHVAGWDDPRMPTIAGLKRRGVPPAAVREFVKRIGVAKANSVVDVGMLEFCIREELNRTALRRMAVLRPLKVVIENYPEGQVEELEAINHPDDPGKGTRKIAFGRELYIEQDDFMENPPKKFFRLSPGNEVRLRYAYFIKCTGVVKNAAGEVVELRCTYDPATRGGNAPDGRKVKATMHWLSAAQSKPAEIRIYNQLFAKPSPDASNFAADLNPQSLEILKDARIEPAIAMSNSHRADAVRAAGLFRARQGFHARPAGVQPHDRPARHVCEGSREGLRGSSRAKCSRPDRCRRPGEVGGCVREARCGGAVVALFAARLPVRIESEFVSGQGRRQSLFQRTAALAIAECRVHRHRDGSDGPRRGQHGGNGQLRVRRGGADGQDHLGDRPRGRRLEDFEPSRVVEGAAAVGGQSRRHPAKAGPITAGVVVKTGGPAAFAKRLPVVTDRRIALADARLSGTTVETYDVSFPRREWRPGFASFVSLSERRGRRECRALAAPAGLVG